ncbi:MAG: hypothetical protein ABMB14_02180 [Myxococcota bacterium]
MRATWSELRHCAATVYAATVRPRVFARGWMDGTVNAANPLALYAFALAVIVPIDRLGHTLALGKGADPPLVWELLGDVAGRFNLMVLGALFHLCIKVFGGRGSLRATVGMLLLVLGGPLMVSEVLGWTLTAIWWGWTGAFPAFPTAPPPAGLNPTPVGGWSTQSWIVMLSTLPMPVYVALTMAEVHRLRWWRVLLALVGIPLVVTVVSALVTALVVVIRGS